MISGVGCTTLPLPEIHASAFFFLSFIVHHYHAHSSWDAFSLSAPLCPFIVCTCRLGHIQPRRLAAHLHQRIPRAEPHGECVPVTTASGERGRRSLSDGWDVIISFALHKSLHGLSYSWVAFS